MTQTPTAIEEILIVTGLSGSGKSVASRALEDVGYFCIDNLPIAMLEDFVHLLTVGRTTHFSRVALVMDSRDESLVLRGRETFKRVSKNGPKFKILFLDCADDELEQRFNLTRRTHPKAQKGTVLEGIAAERGMLTPIREMASVIFDTSDTNIHQLRAWVQESYSVSGQETSFNLTFYTIGFKYRPPSVAHLMFDVRFLPNPFWDENLAKKTGLDPEVTAYLLDFPETLKFLDRLEEMLQFLLPFYRKEGKHYLTVALGCTGGKHRSVAMAEQLAKRFADTSMVVSVHHRDINKT